MRKLCATLLTVAVGWQPICAAAQDAAQPGPLTRSISREAAKLAADSPGRADTPGWQAMREFTRGRVVRVTTATASVTRTFVAADERSLTLLNLGAPGLSHETRWQLFEVARSNPETIVRAAGERSLQADALRIGPDGVFIHDVKIAERRDVILQLPIDEVLMVTTAPQRHGSAVAAVLGMLGGFGVAGLLAGAIGRDCGNHCAGETFAMLAVLPIAAATGAWYGTSRMIEDVIYRRP